MTEFFYSILLGIVEGITEFLPISSTAHLRLTQYALGLDLTDPYWKMFAVVIQLGAICAVIQYYRQKIRAQVSSFLGLAIQNPLSGKALFAHPIARVGVSFFVTAVPSFLLSKVIGDHLESLSVMGGSLAIGGVLMLLFEKYSHILFAEGKTPLPRWASTWAQLFSRPPTGTASLEDINLRQAIWIGALQILAAVFPGTSRSMSTILAGQLAGLPRALALEYSFLLSIPIMWVATAYDLLKEFRSATSLQPDQWIQLTVGWAVSWVVAYGVIAGFLKWVKSKGFAVFAIYRILLGGIILLGLS